MDEQENRFRPESAKAKRNEVVNNARKDFEEAINYLGMLKNIEQNSSKNLNKINSSNSLVGSINPQLKRRKNKVNHI
jgi:hypothetical protein